MTKSIKKAVILLFMVAVCALAGLFTMGSTTVCRAEETLSIQHFNLSFRDNVCVKYAVEGNLENTQVLVWREPSDSYEKGTEEDVLDTVGIQNIDGKDYQIFDYTKLYAKNMTDDVYARAYANVGGTEYYSSVQKYSILQYAYNKLGKTDTATEDEGLKTTLIQMLEYGAAVQTYLNYNVDRLATDDYVQVKLNGGTLSDGFTDGLYKAGGTVTITAPESNSDGDAFTQWVDKDGNVISETPTCELTVGTENNTYTPVYGTEIEPLPSDDIFAGEYMATTYEEIQEFAENVVLGENMAMDCLTNNGGIEFTVESFGDDGSNFEGLQGSGYILPDKAIATFVGLGGERDSVVEMGDWSYFYLDGKCYCDDNEDGEGVRKYAFDIELGELVSDLGIEESFMHFTDMQINTDYTYEWFIDETNEEYVKIKVAVSINEQRYNIEYGGQVTYTETSTTVYVFDKEYKLIALSYVGTETNTISNEESYVWDTECIVRPWNGEIQTPDDLDAYEYDGDYIG